MSDVYKDTLTCKMNRHFGQDDHVLESKLDLSPESKGPVIASEFRKQVTKFFRKKHKAGMIASNCRVEITVRGFDIGYDLGKFHSRVIYELRKVLKDLEFDHPSFSLDYMRDERCPHIQYKMTFRDVEPWAIYRTEVGIE